MAIDLQQLGRLIGRRNLNERGLGMALSLSKGPDYYNDERRRETLESQQAGYLRRATQSLIAARQERERERQERAAEQQRQEARADAKEQRAYGFRAAQTGFTQGQQNERQTERIERRPPPKPPAQPNATQQRAAEQTFRERLEADLREYPEYNVESREQRTYDPVLGPSQTEAKRITADRQQAAREEANALARQRATSTQASAASRLAIAQAGNQRAEREAVSKGARAEEGRVRKRIVWAMGQARKEAIDNNPAPLLTETPEKRASREQKIEDEAAANWRRFYEQQEEAIRSMGGRPGGGGPGAMAVPSAQLPFGSDQEGGLFSPTATMPFAASNASGEVPATGRDPLELAAEARQKTEDDQQRLAAANEALGGLGGPGQGVADATPRYATQPRAAVPPRFDRGGMTAQGAPVEELAPEAPAQVPMGAGAPPRPSAAGQGGFGGDPARLAIPAGAYAEDPETGRRVDRFNVKSPTQALVAILKAKNPAARKMALDEIQSDPETFLTKGVNLDEVFSALEAA